MDGSAGRFEAPRSAVTPLSILEDQITELSAHVAAATFRLLGLIREFDERSGWSGPGMRSCAHWLNWRCSLDIGAAREKLRVAHALVSLPQISGAFERGEVSYSKVRAMTRVATAANEAALLNVALHGTAHHVERLVRGYRRVQRLEDVNGQHAERFVAWHVDEDGCLVIRGRIPGELGALVMKGLEAAQDFLREEARNVAAETLANAQPGTPEPDTAAARRADALALLAETFIAKGPGELAGGERYQVVVHTNENVAVETCRRMGCDCSRVHVTEDASGEPLNVGRKTRSIPPALMRALRLRDQGCRFPGCTCTRYVDGHHIRHWADGGETRLSNLVLLCRFHHRLVHEGGFSVAMTDDGVLVIRQPDGERVAEAGRAGPVLSGAVQLFRAANVARGVMIHPGTGVPRWGGEEMDDDIAISALMRRDGGSGNVSAETRTL